MRVVGVTLRDFRGYRDARVVLGAGLTIVRGPNGAGKTNLLEAVYFGCTGQSCRTANEREVVRLGTPATRVTVTTEDDDGRHELSVGFAPGEPKHLQLDGAPVERLLEAPGRPLLGVFLPDRLELVKGAPALRRAHLDRFVAAMWPARSDTRRVYARTLAQRNALITRVRSGRSSRDSLVSWDAQLATHGIALMRDRTRAVDELAASFTQLSGALGLDGNPSLAYRPRSPATEPHELAVELADRVERDLERGFTGHGPHRDELAILREGQELRVYGSQGERRLAVLSLLLAERETLARTGHVAPLMLLDDVMSELDRDRRGALIEVLHDGGGQSVITTTDLDQVPGAGEPGVEHLAVAEGRVLQEAIAA